MHWKRTSLNASRRSVVAVLLVLAWSSAAAAQPVITGINGSEFPRSGRVAITGSGFSTAGEIRIAGLSAWTSTWTDTRVVAYVPEAAPGPDVNGDGVVNVLDLLMVLAHWGAA